jgi:signal transduction histidine kinase
MRILIAEDDPVARLILRKFLVKLGYEVVESFDGLQAWEILQGEDPPRLLIADWQMPKMEGPELCRKIRGLDSDGYIYVILLTARTESEFLVEGMVAGADDYMTKPFNIREFEVRLQAGRRLLDLQAELAEANDHLEERVAARTQEVERYVQQKNAFINQLGHDLKTPLTPIISLLPKLLKGGLDERGEKIVNLCLENARYMNNLVSKTLSLSRLNSSGLKLNLKSVDLGGALEKILVSLGLNTGSRIEIVNRVDPAIRVLADPTKLRELLENLVHNAEKFTPDSGTITLEAEEKAGWISFSITDTGIGMTQDQLERMFDEFFKADESRHDRSAVGLGLSICRQIIEKHGGKIEALSEGPGKGLTVRFMLQAALEGAAVHEPA